MAGPGGVLTELGARQNPLIEKDDTGAQGDPQTAEENSQQN